MEKVMKTIRFENETWEVLPPGHPTYISNSTMRVLLLRRVNVAPPPKLTCSYAGEPHPLFTLECHAIGKPRLNSNRKAWCGICREFVEPKTLTRRDGYGIWRLWYVVAYRKAKRGELYVDDSHHSYSVGRSHKDHTTCEYAIVVPADEAEPPGEET